MFYTLKMRENKVKIMRHLEKVLRIQSVDFEVPHNFFYIQGQILNDFLFFFDILI